MYTIVGLGNPGQEYELTRHNAGRLVLDGVRKEFGLPAMVNSSKYSGRIAEGFIAGQEVTFLYPATYMNESGKAVRKIIGDEDVSRLIVVYDEVDLPLGEFKVSFGRGDAGHNGVKSITSALGSKEFTRVRIGIAPKSLFGKVVRPRGDKLSGYVLGKMNKREVDKLKSLVPEVAQAIKGVVERGG